MRKNVVTAKYMENAYHSEIMQILLIKGQGGMPVGQLTRMIYNLHTNLFDHKLKYEDLHNTIRWYLWRQSNMRRSPFVRVSYGRYALKPDIAIQLDFCFDEPSDSPNEESFTEENEANEAPTLVRQLTFDF